MKQTKEFQAGMRKVMEEAIAFNRVLGLRVESFDPKAPKLRFDMRPELVGNPTRQILHGGVISATLDVTGGYAIMLRLYEEAKEPHKTFPNMGTIDLRIDYLRPGVGDHFELRAEVMRLGSRVASTRMEFLSADGTLLSTGSAAYIVS